MEERLQENYRGLKRVLLADDDSDDRDLFTEATNFLDPGINITTARDGEELMDFLMSEGNRPDMIFIDLNMPRKNGKECLIEIQNDKNLSKIPVIIYTTSLNQADVDETFNKGALYFFRKPNTFEELKEILYKVFKNNTVNASPRVRENFVLNENLKSVL